jgi:quinol monooxygenase YgiN
MIIIQGTMDCDPAHVKEFAAGARALVEETRKEAGCLAYAMVLEDEKTGRFVLSERWESGSVSQAHMATPHLGAFMGSVAAHLRGADVKTFEVSREIPQGG